MKTENWNDLEKRIAALEEKVQELPKEILHDFKKSLVYGINMYTTSMDELYPEEKAEYNSIKPTTARRGEGIRLNEKDF